MEDALLYEEILHLKNHCEPATLVTLVQSTGSTPRKAGAKMLVRTDGSISGTIGGGRLEYEVIELALQVLAGGQPQTCSFNLTEDFGHACGGSLLFYLEPLTPRPHLVVFGAGHIGRELAVCSRKAGFYVTVVEENRNRPPVEDADQTMFCRFEDAFDQLTCSPLMAIAVVTSEHERDFAIVRSALATESGYIGMLGSRRKRAALMEFLTKEGVAAPDQDRVTTPIGLDIGAETPAEIAVSIVAQLIGFRRRHVQKGCGDRAGSGTIHPNGPLQAASASR